MAIVDDDHAYDILNRLEDSLSKKKHRGSIHHPPRCERIRYFG